MKRVSKKTWFFIGSLVYCLTVWGLLMFAKFAKVLDSGGNEVAIMDGLFAYNWTKIYDTFLLMGEAGRRSYTAFHILDYFFLTAYSLLMMSVTLFFVPNDKKYIAIVLPIITAVLDIIENTILEVLSYHYPVNYPTWAKIAAVFTTLKWCSVVIWVIAFIIIVVMFVINKAKDKKTA